KAQGALSLFLGFPLFSHEWTADDFMDVHFASASENFLAAASDSSTRSWPSRWYTLTARLGSSVTSLRLRTPKLRLRSSVLSTSSTFRVASSRSSTARAFLVLGSLKLND